MTSFAASARVLQLRVNGGGERQVSLTPNATVRRADGTLATAADLRPGQRVQVTGRRGADDALVADEVTIVGGR